MTNLKLTRIRGKRWYYLAPMWVAIVFGLLVAFHQNASAVEHTVSDETGLTSAISSASSGDTIIINNDITLTAALSINKNLTFKSSGTSDVSLIVAAGSAVRHMNLTGGTIALTFSHVILDGNKNSSSTAYGGGITSEATNTTIDGAVIKNCYAENGGGIYSTTSYTSFSIKNSTISSCRTSQYGGGIYLYNNSTTNAAKIINTEVSNNTAPNNGAGMYIFKAELENSAVKENTTTTTGTTANASDASYGIGIYVGNSGQLYVHGGSEISGNSNSSTGYRYGAGIYGASNSTIKIEGSNISENSFASANSYGGGIYAYTNSTVTVSESIIDGNYAYNGGGIYGNTCKSLTSEKSTISGNTAMYGGGVNGTSCSAITVTDTTISGNSAQITSTSLACGGGMYLYGSISSVIYITNSSIYNNTSSYRGGGIYNKSCALEIKTSTINYNTASGYGGGGIAVYSGSLTITDSEVNYNTASTYGYGGGILNLPSQGNDTASNITIDNSEVNNNSASGSTTGSGAGGGIYNLGTLTIKNGSTVNNNYSKGTGGGIYNTTRGNATIDDSEINNNTAAYGGGGVNNNTNSSTITITNSEINNNHDSAGYAYANGGGIYNIGTAEITGCEITYNSVTSTGGGIYNRYALKITDSKVNYNTTTNYGGGLYNYRGATATITNSEVNNNSANNGGGVYNYGTSTIDGSEVSNNSATSNGGGVYDATGDTTIENGSTVSNNEAGINGGGVFCYGRASTLIIKNSSINNNTAKENGGGVYVDDYGSSSDTIEISGATEIYENKAIDGGGIYVPELELLTVSSTDVKFYENEASRTYELIDATDISTHASQIDTDGLGQFTQVGNGLFKYAYNNADVYYVENVVIENEDKSSTYNDTNSDNELDVGEIIDYTIEFETTNEKAIAYDMKFTDTLSQYVDYVANSIQVIIDGTDETSNVTISIVNDVITIDFGRIEGKHTFEINFSVEVTSGEGRLIQNTAIISYHDAYTGGGEHEIEITDENPIRVKGTLINTVTYNPNGGIGNAYSVDATDANSYQHTILSVDDTNLNFSKEGYIIIGWSTDKTATTADSAYSSGTTITVDEDITLYAVWEAKSYTVTYDPNGGSGLYYSVNQDYDSSYTVLDYSDSSLNYSKAGYVFTGWNTQADGGGDAYHAGDSFTVKGDVTLSAQWEETKYHVTYDANGGTGTVEDLIEYPYGSTVTVLGDNNITRQGYLFVEWNTSSNGNGTRYVQGDTFTIESDVTLYAIWEVPSYTITYDANGGTGNYAATIDYNIRYTVLGNVAASIDRYGYTFLGWNTAADGSGTDYYGGNTFIVTEDITLYAQWAYDGSATFTVTYDANGGSSSYMVSGLIHGSTYTVLSDTDTGISSSYPFIGWNTQANGGGTSYAAGETFTITDNITLYAQWGSDRTVTYYANDGGTVSYTYSGITYGSNYTVLSDTNMGLSRTGYTFAGWNTQADGGGTVYSAGYTFNITTDITLYAQWEANTYKINYVLDGGTNDSSNPAEYIYGVGVPSFANATRTGYNFGGWYTDNTFLSPISSISTIDIGDKILYAKWTAVTANSVTITFDGNGADTGSSMATQSATANVSTTLNLNTYTCTGYTFSGWSTTANGSIAYEDGASITPTSDITLYAQWTANKTGGGSSGGGSTTYTVTYDPNGGSGSYKDSGLTAGATYTVKSQSVTEIVRSSYHFTGWNTNADGTGTAYAAADTFTISSNVTLYAQWKSTGDDSLLNTEDHIAYIIGYTDGTVKPTANITRAEVATIYFRLLTETARTSYWSTSNTYSDVSMENWYNNAVSTMSNANILTGYTDGTFGGNENITRAEFAAIAARFDSGAYTGTDKFSDISGHWAAEYINRAAEKGWIAGYSDGTFRPDQYITRAEAMAMINRVLGRDNIAGMHTDMKTWSDNPSTAWYYEAVQEATNSHEYTRDENGYETWTQVTEAPDWSTLEKSWSAANSI